MSIMKFDPIAGNLFEAFFYDASLFKEVPKKYPPRDMYLDPVTQDLVLDFALAGFKKEQLSVAVKGYELIVSAKSTGEVRGEARTIAKRAFSEAVVVSDKYDIEKIGAKFEQGLLTVRVPVKKESTAKTVEIIEIK